MRKADHLEDIASQTQRRKLSHHRWIEDETSSERQHFSKKRHDGEYLGAKSDGGEVQLCRRKPALVSTYRARSTAPGTAYSLTPPSAKIS
jgi:hypothetical protein